MSYESDDFGLLSDADAGFSDEVPLLPLPSVEGVLDSPVLRRLAGAATVVGRVEPGPLEMHRDREQELLHGLAPHTSQAVTAGSLIRWKTSNVWPFGQRYS